MDQGPRSNFEIEGGGGGGHHYWLNNGGGGGEHKILFLTKSL